MKGFPSSVDEFERERKSAISVDSQKVFDAIRENPTVKAVLAELRHTCYHWIGERGEGQEPITGAGGMEKFHEIKTDCEYILGMQTGPMSEIRSVRILDAFGAVVWSKERDA